MSGLEAVFFAGAVVFAMFGLLEIARLITDRDNWKQLAHQSDRYAWELTLERDRLRETVMQLYLEQDQRDAAARAKDDHE